MFKKLVSAFCFLFFSFLYAEDWYICLSSFRDEKSAMKKMQFFEEHDCPTFAGKIETESGTLIRIFYEQKFESQNEAIKFKNQMESAGAFDFLDDDDLWCVQYSDKMYKPNPKYANKKTNKPENISEEEYPPAKKEEPAKNDSPAKVIVEEIPVDKNVEVAKEIPYETPVTVIENKEVIKEVPVEVIKEVPVTKEVLVEVPVTVIEEREVVKEVVREVPTIVIEEVEKPVIKEVVKEVVKEIVKEVPVVKEVVREVVKEVPVEKLVEVVKEVPVEKEVIREVIKEVPVEKIVEVIKEVPVEKETKAEPKNSDEKEDPKADAEKNKKDREKKLKSKKRTLVIRDSDTGEPVEGANINIDEMYDVETGEAGKARIPDEIGDGEHKIVITKEKYVQTEQNVSVSNDNITSINQISIPKAVDYERIKIAVEWTRGITDLDARIVVEGNQIYYKNRKYENVHLDKDSRTAPGVETISIDRVDSEKVYSVYVTDFDNYKSNTSKKLSNSDAKVTIWMNNDYYTTVKPPKNIVGYKWHVFDVIDSEVVLVNTIVAETMKASITKPVEKTKDAK